jgi:hypothetical protein
MTLCVCSSDVSLMIMNNISEFPDLVHSVVLCVFLYWLNDMSICIMSMIDFFWCMLRNGLDGWGNILEVRYVMLYLGIIQFLWLVFQTIKRQSWTVHRLNQVQVVVQHRWRKGSSP